MRPRWLGGWRVWVRPADPPPDGGPDTRPLLERLIFFLGWGRRW